MATIRFGKGNDTQPQSKGNRVISHHRNDLGGRGRGFAMTVSNPGAGR
jgi:hypothetical protein